MRYLDWKSLCDSIVKSLTSPRFDQIFEKWLGIITAVHFNGMGTFWGREQWCPRNTPVVTMIRGKFSFVLKGAAERTSGSACLIPDTG